MKIIEIKYKNEIILCKVDDEDFARITEYSWCSIFKRNKHHPVTPIRREL